MNGFESMILVLVGGFILGYAFKTFTLAGVMGYCCEQCWEERIGDLLNSITDDEIKHLTEKITRRS